MGALRAARSYNRRRSITIEWPSAAASLSFPSSLAAFARLRAGFFLGSPHRMPETQLSIPIVAQNSPAPEHHNNMQQRSAGMACVELEGFLDFGGYLITISIAEREGGWWCWAQFEEVVEYDGSLQIPVYRHRVPGAFKTREGSIDAGIAYARQTVEAGKVVIQAAAPHARQHQSWGLH